MISTGRFLDFIKEVVDINNEEKVYNLWLHRVFDKNYEEFKNSVISRSNQEADQDVETTIKNSKEILNNFKPEKR